MQSENTRSLEQIYRSAVSGLYARIRSNYDFIYREMGDDGLKMIAEMSREYGLTIAERAKKRLNNNDLESVAGYLIRIFDTVGRGKEDFVIPLDTGKSSITIKVNQCPLHFDLPAMCLAHTTMEKTVVEQLNPALTYRIGRSIPAGDTFCEHIIEFK